jgi:hypothetical protein
MTNLERRADRGVSTPADHTQKIRTPEQILKERCRRTSW